MTVTKLILVASGGAIGAVVRYGVGVGTKAWFGETVPVGTLIVNVVGCFLFGVVLKSKLVPDDYYPLVAVGFLGALTTFSTFGAETLLAVEQGSWKLAVGNVLANVAFGLLAVWLGASIGKVIGADV